MKEKTDEAAMRLDDLTIADFGDQWSRFTENDGYYASVECLQDILGPLLDATELRDCYIGDIGSGTGRIVRMLLDVGAKRVVAVEPSRAMDVLEKNVADRLGRVSLVRSTGVAIDRHGPFDFVFSIGVLHNIADPDPVVSAAYRALNPGGRIVIWVYGLEGNRFYLAVARPLRWAIRILPYSARVWVCRVLALLASAYARLCTRIALPLADYMRNHFLLLDHKQRWLTVYDQLNPAHAKYYKHAEVDLLLRKAGFTNVKLYRRHGYSWTATGVRGGN